MRAEASCLRNSSPPNGSNITSGGFWRGVSGPIPSYSTCAPCGPFTTGPSNRGFSPLRAAILFDLSALHPKYALARDLFMFSFYTRGMSFVDMIYLRKSDVRDGVLTYRRKKTGQTLSLRVEAPLQEIIDRYDSDSPYVLPVLTADDSYRAYRQQQRELNKFIRKIGELLEISEPLTFYVARHSWATLARDCGTPLTVISAGMGHTSERTTRVYLAQLDRSVIDKANRKIINL